MKLIIDIPDYSLNDIQNGSIACGQVLKAVKNGIPYEERPQGEWVFKDLHNGKTWYECSICGRKIHIGDKAQLSDFPFCHCGADMRKEGVK